MCSFSKYSDKANFIKVTYRSSLKSLTNYNIVLCWHFKWVHVSNDKWRSFTCASTF